MSATTAGSIGPLRSDSGVVGALRQALLARSVSATAAGSIGPDPGVVDGLPQARLARSVYNAATVDDPDATDSQLHASLRVESTAPALPAWTRGPSQDDFARVGRP